MMLRKTSIALGTAITALVGLSVADSASARGYLDGSYYFGYRGGGAFQLYRAPQPSQSLPKTTPRPSNRDMRGAPSGRPWNARWQWHVRYERRDGSALTKGKHVMRLRNTPLALAAMITALSAASAQDWRTYSNARYGFSLQYPSDIFAEELTTEAGDGQLFVAKNGDARLLVGSLTNDTGFTPLSYQTYVAQNSYADYRISYRRLGGSWFALSGEGNGKIFYEKAMFSCAGRRINSFAVIYPSDQRGVFDRIVDEDSFRAGRRC
jgi:hypothetical protein